MRILFLTPWYPSAEIPHRGIFVRDQAAALAEKHEVLLIASWTDYSRFGLWSCRFTESRWKNLREFRLIIRRSLPVYNQLHYFIVSYRAAIKTGKDFNPDIIHGNIAYPGAFWTWLVARALGKPFIVTDHLSRLSMHFRKPLYKTLTVFAMRKAKRLIAVSQAAAADMMKHGLRPVDVVPNVIDISSFQPASPPKTLPWRVGFLGNVNTDIKGLDLLLRAMSRTSLNFHLLIGGGGSLLESYRKLASELGIAEKCSFSGMIRPESVPAFLSELHFFVSSSRSESFGIAIAQAMACGLPVVCTRSGGPESFVTPSCGILVPAGDEEELRAGIERMVAEYHSFNKETIREYVMKELSVPAFVSRMERIYQEVTAESLTG
jgi:glycosyltransferase involved in cell wall biosynthesis